MKKILFLVLVLVSLTAWGQGVGQGFTPSVGAGDGVVDSTRLVQDSIQVYFLDGVELRRDTVRVRGEVTISQLDELRTEIPKDSLVNTAENGAIYLGLPSEETGTLGRVFGLKLATRDALKIEDRTGVNGFSRSQNVIFNGEVNGIEGSDANWVAGGSTGAGNWIYGTSSLNRLNSIYGGYFDTITNCLASSLVHTMRSSLTNSTHSAILAGSRNRMTDADYSGIGIGANNHLNGADYSWISSGNLNTVVGPYNFLGTPISANVSGNGNSVLNGNVVNVTGNFNFVGRGTSSSITGGGNYMGIGGNLSIVGESNFVNYGSSVSVTGNYNFVDIAYFSKVNGPLAKISGVGVAGRKGGDARASGYFEEIGDAQTLSFVGTREVGIGGTGDLRMNTNPFSPTLISSRIDMRDSTVATVIVQVTARNQSGTKAAGYQVKAVVVKSGGVIGLKSNTTEVIFEDVSTWDVRVEKIDNASIYIRVYGDPSDVTRWLGKTTITELKWD